MDLLQDSLKTSSASAQMRALEPGNTQCARRCHCYSIMADVRGPPDSGHGPSRVACATPSICYGRMASRLRFKPYLTSRSADFAPHTTKANPKSVLASSRRFELPGHTRTESPFVPSWSLRACIATKMIRGGKNFLSGCSKDRRFLVESIIGLRWVQTTKAFENKAKSGAVGHPCMALIDKFDLESKEFRVKMGSASLSKVVVYSSPKIPHNPHLSASLENCFGLQFAYTRVT